MESGLAAFAIGIVSGFLTVTAGAAVTVVVPVLLALGLSADEANATSRLSLGLAGVVAGLMMIRRGVIDWPKTVPLLAAAAGGTAAGALAGARIDSGTMLTIIVVTSCVSLVLVWMRPDRWLAEEPQRAVVPGRGAALVFFFLCAYEGIVAVDSALLRLIVFVMIFGYPIAVANPIKLVTGLVMFGVSSAIYGAKGQIVWDTAGWLAAGSTLGAVAAVPFATSMAAQRPIYRLLQCVVTLETIWLVHRWWAR
ncbi:MAG: sulfite exporter TauE/SafE family protein [Terrimicrobiaceae bacterium]|nr:sulfite exporter TauE/SafE family protein [Terrimicrobiaceae bacterium]